MAWAGGESYLWGICMLRLPACCWLRWKPEQVIEVPKTAYFTDYSAMAFDPDGDKLAILSQENAALWVGAGLAAHCCAPICAPPARPSPPPPGRCRDATGYWPALHMLFWFNEMQLAHAGAL